MTDLTTSGPVMYICPMPSTMKMKSVIAGEYTAPPAQGPAMTVICGMTPDANVFRRNTSPYPANESMPSWILAPPESLIPTIGAPTFMAWSITFAIFCAAACESEPPNTVKSCAYANTVRPSTAPHAVTTESPSYRCLSKPRSVERCATNESISVNAPPSNSIPSRSRAVSLPLSRWDLSLRSPPPINALERRDSNADTLDLREDSSAVDV